MSQIIILLIIAVPAVLLFVLLYWFGRVRRREALFRWASANGYRILSYRQPIPTEASAFPVSVSKAQQVFKVEVEDGQGNHHSGWVRLGDAWRGLASNAADVQWE